MKKSNRRDLFPGHGPGKGDKNRTANVKAWRDNHEKVKWSGVPATQDPAFKTRGGKAIKHYGPRKPETFETITSRLVIH